MNRFSFILRTVSNKLTLTKNTITPETAILFSTVEKAQEYIDKNNHLLNSQIIEVQLSFLDKII